jgi:hypothetical protein
MTSRGFWCSRQTPPGPAVFSHRAGNAEASHDVDDPAADRGLDFLRWQGPGVEAAADHDVLGAQVLMQPAVSTPRRNREGSDQDNNGQRADGPELHPAAMPARSAALKCDSDGVASRSPVAKKCFEGYLLTERIVPGARRDTFENRTVRVCTIEAGS